MRNHITENLLNYPQKLLKYKEYARLYPWWFALFLDLLHVMNLHYVKEIYWLNQLENRPSVKTMKENLLDYDAEG